jgi:hypothetical protein
MSWDIFTSDQIELITAYDLIKPIDEACSNSKVTDITFSTNHSMVYLDSILRIRCCLYRSFFLRNELEKELGQKLAERKIVILLDYFALFAEFALNTAIFSLRFFYAPIYLGASLLNFSIKCLSVNKGVKQLFLETLIYEYGAPGLLFCLGLIEFTLSTTQHFSNLFILNQIKESPASELRFALYNPCYEIKGVPFQTNGFSNIINIQMMNKEKLSLWKERLLKRYETNPTTLDYHQIMAFRAK